MDLNFESTSQNSCQFTNRTENDLESTNFNVCETVLSSVIAETSTDTISLIEPSISNTQLPSSDNLKSDKKNCSAAHRKLQALMLAGHLNNDLCKIKCKDNSKNNFICLEDSGSAKENAEEKENISETDNWFSQKLGWRTQKQDTEAKINDKSTVGVKKYKIYKEQIEKKLSIKRREDLERRNCFYNADNEVFSNKDEEEEEEEFSDKEDEEFSNKEVEEFSDKEDEELSNKEDGDDENVDDKMCDGEEKSVNDQMKEKKSGKKRKILNEDESPINPKRSRHSVENDIEEENSVFNNENVVIESEDSLDNLDQISSNGNESSNVGVVNCNDLSHITLDLNGREGGGLNTTASQDFNEALFLCSGTFDSNEKSLDSVGFQKQTLSKFLGFSNVPDYDSSSQKSCNEISVNDFSSLSSKPSESLAGQANKEEYNRTFVATQMRSTVVFSDSEDSNLSMSSYSRGATKMGPSKLTMVDESAPKMDWSLHEKDFKSLQKESEKKDDVQSFREAEKLKYLADSSNDLNINDSGEEVTPTKLIYNSKNKKTLYLAQSHPDEDELPQLVKIDEFINDSNEKKENCPKRNRIFSDSEDEVDGSEINNEENSKKGNAVENVASTLNPMSNLFADDQLFTVDDDEENDFVNINHDNVGNKKNILENEEEHSGEEEKENDASSRNMKIKDIFDDEASLSGDDVGSDSENEEEGNEYEMEEGDNDELPDEDEIRSNLIRQYIKQSNDEEERRILKLQEQFFVDSDLHGAKNMDRSFRFRMRNDGNVDWSKVLGKLDEDNTDYDEEEAEECNSLDARKMNERKIEMLNWKLEQEKRKAKFNNANVECIEIFAQSSLLSLGEKTIFGKVPDSPATSRMIEDECASSVIIQRDSLLHKAGGLGHMFKECSTTMESRRHAFFMPSKSQSNVEDN